MKTNRRHIDLYVLLEEQIKDFLLEEIRTALNGY